MTPEMRAAFMTLHRDVPREGPGEAADVIWAAECASLSANARIADLGCGPGADIAALRHVAPEGSVWACDLLDHFVEAARTKHGHDPAVTVVCADMRDIAGSFDMIWCVGAIYFLGVGAALQTWRPALRHTGVIAFSDPFWRVASPSEPVRAAWQDYPAMTDLAGMTDVIEASGYQRLGTRVLSDAAWEAYYTPLDARITTLRQNADATLMSVLDEAEKEAAIWRSHGDEFGYALHVVAPKVRLP